MRTVPFEILCEPSQLNSPRRNWFLCESSRSPPPHPPRDSEHAILLFCWRFWWILLLLSFNVFHKFFYMESSLKQQSDLCVNALTFKEFPWKISEHLVCGIVFKQLHRDQVNVNTWGKRRRENRGPWATMLTWVNSYKSLNLHFSFSDSMATNQNEEYAQNVNAL